MHETQIRSDRPLRKAPEYLIQQPQHSEITSGAFLLLFFAASIVSVIVSTLIR
ncbi:hypothetical protein [Camelimonas lactis]|uniref:Uncharacterized protein n=1 Tax=Camelimonas lactis TaxID=659006 RepID=A0A4R2GJP5_9HYPH|nr:hypothetical protein [Camelimonas lactis]TCO09006.1 hypothetical protein EV666_1191 [Camelimonas lactis]